MMYLKLLVFKDLFKRYLGIFKFVWKRRREMDVRDYTQHELAFLPGHLELVETPVHPVPRWTMRILAALVVVGLLIALIGKLDIVVVAKGKLVPNARVKTIQPSITGVVREILVQDGQRVSAGQVLVRLDKRQAEADVDKARASKLDSSLAAARAYALLLAQKEDHLPHMESVDGASKKRAEEAERVAEAMYKEYKDKLSSAGSELLKQKTELEVTNEQIAKLVATAPLARRQANDYKSLIVNRYVAKDDYLDKEQAALGQEHDLAGQRIHARELMAGIAGQEADIESIKSQFRRQELDEFEKETQQVTQSQDDEAKAVTRLGLLTLTAPVSGTVQQLAIHTLGGVVTTAQQVMEIVPDDSLEIEAAIENKDIGFVNEGQNVVVKVEAFPYTHYGYLEGKVVSVSNDAVQDKKLGLTFQTRIHLNSNKMHIANKWISLTPGMAVSAEVKTGRRHIAEYFLGPLVENAQESMRER